MKISDVYSAVCALLNTKPVFCGSSGSDDDPDPVLAESTRLHERERFLGICGLAYRFLYPVYLDYCKRMKTKEKAFPEAQIRFCDFVFFPDPFIPALCALTAYLTQYRTEHRTLYENELKAIFSGFDPVITSIGDVYENV